MFVQQEFMAGRREDMFVQAHMFHPTDFTIQSDAACRLNPEMVRRLCSIAGPPIVPSAFLQSQSGTSGTLIVTSGAAVQTLTLLGQYSTAKLQRDLGRLRAMGASRARRYGGRLFG